ncbi:sensor histidine kinase KdpD [Clostridium sp. YIM B02551]|uniref:sensor histidine kinase n=1 Tax=Clostridium sp. YIM B02551 TaxID=2910679 RepID=UPI001EEB3C6D|nr:HAMP domain-containing sensor histidine kinase [Clostridium sp. YIM B02551]
MIWITAILIIFVIILLSYIFRLKYDIRYITKQVSKSKGEYSNVRMTGLDKDVENLVVNINNLYEIQQKINVKIKSDEEKLRESIANLSHDLRTPLTSIMGYIQLIKDGNISKEEKDRYLEIVERRTGTLQSLITSFYDLSRIEGKEYKFDLKSVSLGDMLCETLALFYEDFINKNIEPNVNIEENVPRIISDEKAVIRIFSNLINNVLEHGKNRVDINLRQENNYIITEFKNDAPNLNEENVTHIFDRFFTADLARSEKNSGLGLCITKALLEQLGHEVEAILYDGVLTIKIKWKIKFNNI